MNKTKSILRLAISIALAFTFSCSSGGDDNSSGNGQGVPFNENSQIYNAYWEKGEDDEIQHIGEAYKGSGVIDINGMNAGSVTNGIVNLNLPKSIPNEYLSDFIPDEYQSYCSAYPTGIKVFKVYGLYLTASNGKSGSLDLYIQHDNGKFGEGIYYFYFSKSGKIACNFESTSIYDIDAQEGWNTIYLHEDNNTDGPQIEKWSTKNILTREMKWTIETR